MLKYLSCPDIHFSPDWIETSRMVLRAVIKNAQEQAVDFVLFPGDLFDKAIYATDKGGINELIKLITKLRTVCPVAAIYGTPSHDYKGCYGSLELVGLQVLQPGKMYGYKKRLGHLSNIEMIDDDFSGYPDCLLFGIPEVTKDWYQSEHKDVSADKVNAACVNLVHDLIRNEIAPMRSAYPNIPAVGMIHANVSDALDKGSEHDIIIKASDVVIRTHAMTEADMTRWECGHIHIPWESKVVNGGYSGYAGIDRNPWGKTGFVPAMTLVKMDEDGILVSKTRLPYGTPKRIKITEPLASYDPDVAYWLDTKNPDDIDPEKFGAHPWSRITYNIESKTERRVDVSGLAEAKTLPELGKLYDKNITYVQLKKLAQAERQTPKPPVVQRDVRVAYVKAKGLIMAHGKTIEMWVEKLPNGLIQIVGPNGSGKSSTIGLVTPFPCFVGKDTDSGRLSAIKDFFDQPESGLEKIVYLNGIRHDHVITVRGAHTKTPKIECYLSINGVPQLEKPTFEQMMSKCEELYGSLSDYLMTSFYVQPLQGKFESGLMTANMVTVRDLVQNIAGTNHEAEKRYCLDRVNEIDDATKEEHIRIDTERGTLADIPTLEQNKLASENLRTDLQQKLEIVKASVSVAESAYAQIKSRFDHDKENRNRRTVLGGKIFTTQCEIEDKTKLAEKLIAAAGRVNELKQNLAIDDAIKSEYNAALEELNLIDKCNADAKTEYQKTKTAMSEIMAEVDRKKASAREKYNEAHTSWQNKKSEIDAEKNKISAELQKKDAEIEKIKADAHEKYNKEHAEWQQQKYVNDANTQKKESLERRIADINKPCPNCGYIDPEIKSVIAQIQQEIDSLEFVDLSPEPQYSDPDVSDVLSEIDVLNKKYDSIVYPPEPQYADPDLSELRTKYAQLMKTPEPEPLIYTMPSRGMSDSEIQQCKQAIESAQKNQTESETIKSTVLPSLEKQLADYKAEYAGITVEDIDMTQQETSLKQARENLESANNEIARVSSEISQIVQQIADTKKRSGELDDREAKLSEQLSALADWKYLSDILSPPKLPAMELDAVLDTIDAEATKQIVPYRDGRYMYRTLTQQNGKSSVIDKFDIVVHDGETGEDKSLLKYSVGEKSFLQDAYVKALVKIRTARTKTSYSPIISDEADSFIEIPQIPAYYEMQKNYYGGDSRVLVVSHSPDAGNYIQNHVDMGEIVK